MEPLHLSHDRAPTRERSRRHRLLRLVLPALAAAGVAVVAAPSTALAFHTDISGTASCLAADGSYTVTWTVTVPNEAWAIGYTATLSASVPLSPGGSLGPGQTATGTGSYTGASATISVTSTWTVPTTETNTATVLRPTTPCPTPTTTPATTTTAPATTTTTTLPADVCTNIDGVQGAVPAGYVASGTTCTLATAAATTTTTPSASSPTDVCSNLAGVQTSVPSGYVLRNGRCVSTNASGAGVSGTSGNSGLLPATGGSSTPTVLALALVLGGAGLLAGSRRRMSRDARAS